MKAAFRVLLVVFAMLAAVAHGQQPRLLIPIAP